MAKTILTGIRAHSSLGKHSDHIVTVVKSRRLSGHGLTNSRSAHASRRHTLCFFFTSKRLERSRWRWGDEHTGDVELGEAIARLGNGSLFKHAMLFVAVLVC